MARVVRINRSVVATLAQQGISKIDETRVSKAREIRERRERAAPFLLRVSRLLPFFRPWWEARLSREIERETARLLEEHAESERVFRRLLGECAIAPHWEPDIAVTDEEVERLRSPLRFS